LFPVEKPMETVTQALQEARASVVSAVLIRPVAFHDLARQGNAFIADVYLWASNQLCNVGLALATERTGQSLWSNMLCASFVEVIGDHRG